MSRPDKLPKILTEEETDRLLQEPNRRYYGPHRDYLSLFSWHVAGLVASVVVIGAGFIVPGLPVSDKIDVQLQEGDTKLFQLSPKDTIDFLDAFDERPVHREPCSRNVCGPSSVPSGPTYSVDPGWGVRSRDS